MEFSYKIENTHSVTYIHLYKNGYHFLYFHTKKYFFDIHDDNKIDVGEYEFPMAQKLFEIFIVMGKDKIYSQEFLFKLFCFLKEHKLIERHE